MPETANAYGQLMGVIQKVRKSIKQVRDRDEHISEEATKTALINPVLSALGWDLTDLDEVVPEYKHTDKDNPVDYALLLRRSPCLFVEAKALDTNLNDHKCLGQIIGYATMAGVDWCVLTDGDTYAIYNAHASVEVEQKLFRRVRMSDSEHDEGLMPVLELLSKDKMSGKIIDDLWKAHFVDRTVQKAVRSLFDTRNRSLINWIKKRCPELTPSDIKGSLERADIIVEFPASPTMESVPDETPPATEVVSPAPPKNAKKKTATIADLVQAHLVQPGDQWRGRSKGIETLAEVRADGCLVVNGKAFASPSGAGTEATEWTAVDGWHFWRFQDSDGTWKKIDELRNRLRELQVEGGHLSLSGKAEQSPLETGKHLQKSPESRELFLALLSRLRDRAGDVTVGANSKHITFSHGSVFAAISVLKKGLRIGLRLDESEAQVHSRLKVQPKGVFEGWSALHVSVKVSQVTELDGELIDLLEKARMGIG